MPDALKNVFKKNVRVINAEKLLKIGWAIPHDWFNEFYILKRLYLAQQISDWASLLFLSDHFHRPTEKPTLDPN